MDISIDVCIVVDIIVNIAIVMSAAMRIFNVAMDVNIMVPSKEVIL